MLSFPFPAPGVLSVSELNRRVREVLEGNFPLLWVGGELSNVTRAASGHWYFSLKDAGAQVRCVMFRHKNQFLDWQPRDGMQVEVRALVTLYEPRGDFQLSVETMRRAGLGALFEAFERLKARLEAEGLFDAARKRALPLFPRAIGIVTSPAAAALRDVLSTLVRRMPGVPVIVYPTPVQGEGAAPLIAQAIATAGRRRECDVLIVCRGGGSLEDLWPFNEEAVARAIAACPIPIVSGVGHETDFTIADFVADRRAPTPTAAAQLAAPDREELSGRLAALWRRLHRVVSSRLENRMQHLDHLARRLVHPGERIAARITHLRHLQARLAQAIASLVETRRWRLNHAARRLSASRPDLEARLKTQQVLAQRLDRALVRRLETLSARLEALRAHLLHLNPQAVLERGYSIVSHQDGRIVRDSAALLPGETVRLRFARGGAAARITAKE